METTSTRPRTGAARQVPSGVERVPAPPHRLTSQRLRLIGADVALDVTVVAVGLAAAALSARASGQDAAPLGWLVAYGIGVVAALALAGVYRPRIVPHFLDDARAVLGATAIVAMGVVFARELATATAGVAPEQVRVWIFVMTCLLAARGGFELGQARYRRSGRIAEPALIVGAGRVGRQIARRLLDHPEFGLRPVAFFDDDPLETAEGPELPVIGSKGGDAQSPDRFADRVEATIREFGTGYVIVTFSLAGHDLELALVKRCQALGVSVSLIPRLFEGVPDQTRLERLGGMPLISVLSSDPRGWKFSIKYALDRVGASLAIAVLSPVFLVAGVGTLLTLGRPILFRQRRVGIDGRVFDMLKFRTMRPADEVMDASLEEDLEGGLAPGGVEGRDRRTRLGTLLRRTAIDELPQLFNVLRGDMSLIGPRPERPEFADRFRHDVYRYADRLRVKSGVTGWAQVHGLRGRTSLADRVEWDNYYIENWSPWLDLKILVLTLLVVVRDPAE